MRLGLEYVMDVNIILAPEAVATTAVENSGQVLAELSTLFAETYDLDSIEILSRVPILMTMYF